MKGLPTGIGLLNIFLQPSKGLVGRGDIGLFSFAQTVIIVTEYTFK